MSKYSEPCDPIAVVSEEVHDLNLGETSHSSLVLGQSQNSLKFTRAGTNDRGSSSTFHFENERKSQLLERAFTQDSDGDTYLHRYICQGEWQLAMNLIDIAPNCGYLNLQNHLQQTPLHLAAVMNNMKVMSKLLQMGADLSIVDNRGNNIFHIISQLGNQEALQAVAGHLNDRPHLTKIQKAVNASNNEGVTPMIIAIRQRRDSILRQYPSFGADVNLTDKRNGESPLHEAVRSDNIACVDFLLKNCHADVNICDFRSVTPLHLSAGLGRETVVACLLMNGADLNLRDDEGRRPSDVAITDDLAELLR